MCMQKISFARLPFEGLSWAPGGSCSNFFIFQDYEGGSNFKLKLSKSYYKNAIEIFEFSQYICIPLIYIIIYSIFQQFVGFLWIYFSTNNSQYVSNTQKGSCAKNKPSTFLKQD